jgi:mannose-6-phosphate isomerase-like protein (cupin superfamily)
MTRRLARRRPRAAATGGPRPCGGEPRVARLPVAGQRPRARCRDRAETVLRVLDGIVLLDAGDDELVLTPYEVATIPAGVPHRYPSGRP